MSGHAGGTHMAALVEAGETLLAELPDLQVAVVNLLDLLREVVAARPELVQTRGRLPRRGSGNGPDAGGLSPPGAGHGPGGVAHLSQVSVGAGQAPVLAGRGVG